MNERIDALIDKMNYSGLIYQAGDREMSVTGRDLEYFAELIVRECADVIQKEVSMKYKDGGETEEFMGGHYASSMLARVKIKHHFGVKE